MLLQSRSWWVNVHGIGHLGLLVVHCTICDGKGLEAPKENVDTDTKAKEPLHS